MKTYKYSLNKIGVTQIELPLGAEIKSIQNQFEILQMWCLVNPDVERTEIKKFEVYNTGEEITFEKGFKREHVSTVQFSEGSLVVHVFEVIQID